MPQAGQLGLYTQQSVTVTRQRPATRREPTQRVMHQASIQDAFTEWIGENKELVDAIIRFAKEARAAGHKKYGIKAIVERTRWHFHVERREQADWKINNNYTSRLARFLMVAYPELKDLFETRKLKRD